MGFGINKVYNPQRPSIDINSQAGHHLATLSTCVDDSSSVPKKSGLMRLFPSRAAPTFPWLNGPENNQSREVDLDDELAKKGKENV